MCDGDTGHAEAVLVEFDPSVLSYEALLDRFWRMHDYTHARSATSQYRAAIFVRNAEQRAMAEASLRKLEESRRSARPVTTRIEPAGVFWRAEDYHQRFYERMKTACRWR